MKKILFPMMMMAATTTQAFADVNGVDGVIGEDERVQITSQNKAPIYNSIGLLLLRFGNGYATCTGTVVGPRHVITAAHCLVDEDAKLEEVTFIPGVKDSPSNTRAPFGVFNSVNVVIPKAYSITPETEFDVGLIKLDRDLPVPSLPIAVAPHMRIRPVFTIAVAGYPGDKETGTMWESKRSISLKFAFDEYGHDLDTVAGMSGSAMRINDSVIGIHSSGSTDKQGNYVKNNAKFFSEADVKILNEWIREL
jgi:V8-like Glu-specific endopeptidase